MTFYEWMLLNTVNIEIKQFWVIQIVKFKSLKNLCFKMEIVSV